MVRPKGFINVVTDGKTKRILDADASSTVIRDAIHIHPTLAEAVQSVLTSFE